MAKANPPSLQTDLGNKVAELGGRHEYDLTPKTTHLIVGEYDTTKYRHVAKSRPDIKPMAMGWVDAMRDLWVRDDHIDFRALEKKWTLQPFETGGGAFAKSGEVGLTNKLLCCISGIDEGRFCFFAWPTSWDALTEPILKRNGPSSSRKF